MSCGAWCSCDQVLADPRQSPQAAAVRGRFTIQRCRGDYPKRELVRRAPSLPTERTNSLVAPTMSAAPTSPRLSQVTQTLAGGHVRGTGRTRHPSLWSATVQRVPRQRSIPKGTKIDRRYGHRWRQDVPRWPLRPPCCACPEAGIRQQYARYRASATPRPGRSRTSAASLASPLPPRAGHLRQRACRFEGNRPLRSLEHLGRQCGLLRAVPRR
jgi:hypothetical protein